MDYKTKTLLVATVGSLLAVALITNIPDSWFIFYRPSDGVIGWISGIIAFPLAKEIMRVLRNPRRLKALFSR